MHVSVYVYECVEIYIWVGVPVHSKIMIPGPNKHEVSF